MKRRTFFGLATSMTMIVMLAVGGIAFADNTVADGDDTTPVVANPLSFGTVCINSTTNAGALVALSRNGAAGSPNVFMNGSIATVTVRLTSGTGLSAAMDSPPAILLPPDWSALPINTMSKAVSSTVTLQAGSTAGPFSGSVTYRTLGVNSSGVPIIRDGTMSVSATVSDTGACAPTPSDTTAPAVQLSLPSPVAGNNGWFNSNDVLPVVGTVTASDSSNVASIQCSGATVSNASGYGTNTASADVTVSGNGTHSVSCTATDGANPSNTGAASGSNNTATVKIDATPPALGHSSLTPASNGNGWNNTDVAFNYTCSDTGSSGLASIAATGAASGNSTTSPLSVTVSGEAANQEVKGTCTDTAGNQSVDNVTGISIDKQAPNAPTADVQPPPNSKGWNNTTPVTVSFTADGDNGPSGVDACTANSALTSETGGTTVTGTCTDLAGNTGPSVSATVKIDVTDPNAPSASAGTPDYTDPSGHAWYKDSATVTFASNGDPDLADGTVGGSGVDASTIPAGQSFNTLGSHTASGTVKDNAGNQSAQGSTTVYVDNSKPTVQFTSCPSTVTLNASNATAAWSASDTGSGLATSSDGTVNLPAGTVGSHTVFAPTAQDNVGHSSNPATCTYNVQYGWTGFYTPVDNSPTVNTGKSGRTYPVKWSLQDANGTYIGDLSAIKSVDIRKVSCGSFSGDPTDGLEIYNTSPTSLRYDSTANQYIYNWQTPSGAACYSLFVTVNDGSSAHAADFQLTK